MRNRQFSLLTLLGFAFLSALLARPIVRAYLLEDPDASFVVPTTWDLVTGKNVLWRRPLGSQTWRAPVLDADRLYIGTNNTSGFVERYPASVDLGVLLCVRKSDGELLWQHSSEKLPTGRVHDWPLQGITSRPCVEGDRLWYVTNRCEVVCLDTNGFRDGENDPPFQDEPSRQPIEADVVWSLDMMEALNVQPHNISTCTIAVWQDRIFVVTGNAVGASHQTPIANAPSFLALNKMTGKVIWTDDSPGQNILHGQWGSPTIAWINGEVQVIFPGGDGWLYSFDPGGAQSEDGSIQSKLIWKFDCNPKSSKWQIFGQGDRNNLLHGPTVKKGLVYIAVGQDPEHGSGPGRCWCLDPAGRTGDISPEIVYNQKAPTRPIPHRRLQACDPERGDFTRSNPNSAVVWEFAEQDASGDGEITIEETMHRSFSTVEIKDDLLFVTDGEGIVHCLDRRTGNQHWAYDMFAATYSSPIIAGEHVYVGDEDGDLVAFKLSSDPDVAMNAGEPIHESNAPVSIYGSVQVQDNVLYLATKNELIAIGNPTQ